MEAGHEVARNESQNLGETRHKALKVERQLASRSKTGRLKDNNCI